MFRALLPVPLVRTRPTLLAACLAFSLQAYAGPLHFQLPAQPLAASLSQIAQQAKIQLLFDEQLLRNAKAPALQGDYSPEEAIRTLLQDGRFNLVKVDNTYIVRPADTNLSSGSALQLGAMSVIGNGTEVDSSSVGRSTLNQAEIDRHQATNVVSLIDTLPGVSLGGSLKPGGQTINIWGLGDAEDVPMSVDGATKSGFERYQQGSVFIEPELIKRIEVEKGPHSPETGNGGFGGTVHMETKDAPDLLQEGRNAGAMVKYGYSSNSHEQAYTGAVYGRTDDHRFDALAYWTKRDGDDMKIASAQPDPRNAYPINPKRLPNTAQDMEGELFKLNMQLTDEHRLGFSYMRSNSDIWAPFSAKSYPTPPSQSDINKYGYDGATRRFLAQRNTIDTTWIAKYQYTPVDNPWIDFEAKYSDSTTDQTDERGPNAFFQPASGGRKITVGYDDKILALKNTSRFSTGPLEHALTNGIQIRKHTREVDMHVVVVEVRTDVAARRSEADHHVIDAPARQEAEVLQQLGDFRDELVHGLDQQGPVAFRQLAELVFGEGPAAQFPWALAVFDHQARFDFFFQGQAGQFVRFDRAFEVRQGLTDQQGFLLPVVTQKFPCSDAAQKLKRNIRIHV